MIASVLIQQRWNEEPVTSLDNQFSLPTRRVKSVLLTMLSNH